MLKTVKKFAWLFACAALVFGAVSCSDPEDPAAPATSGPATEQPGDSTFESKTETINIAELGVTAVAGLVNSDSTVAEVSENELVVTIVSKKAGTTTATAKLTITGVTEAQDGEIVITVAADGSITYEITKPEIPGGNEGGSDTPSTGGDVTVPTSYSEGFASLTKDGTAVSFDSAWVPLAAGTYDTASGIKVITGAASDTKIAKKSMTVGDKTGDNCLQFGKSLNGNKLIIPVKANCTISFLFDSNKDPSTDLRSLLATATASGATVKDGTSGTAGTTAFHAISGSRVKEYFSFVYEGGEGTVEITCCKDAAGESAGGAVYLYGIDVEY